MTQAKKINGFIVSDKMKDTAVVNIETQKKDKKYKKSFKSSKKIQIDDKGNKAKIGDYVQIEETRPISKSKSWKLTKIITAFNEEKVNKKA